MGEFLMPSLGADMTAGTLLEWYVKPGDTVKRGDTVAAVDTSKAEIDVEIFEDGVIEELLVDEGTRVPVGTVLATVVPIGASGIAATAPAVGLSPPVAPLAPAAIAPPPAPPVGAEPREEHRFRISPLARRAAAELGVDLGGVEGSGPAGAITLADVERTGRRAPAPMAVPPAPVAARPDPADADRRAAMREAIGALMARSKREIPHYYLQLEIDMSSSLEWLHEANRARAVDERLLPSALLLSAVARAAREMPGLNGHWVNGSFEPGSGIHLGVAISLRGGGLIAPALHDADARSLDEIMSGVRDLVQRARAGRLRSSEMSDPTITVTNLGDRGVDLVHGVIYPPQVALVGFGVVRDRPWAAGGLLGARPTVIATLAADHRASDGHDGGRLLALIDRQLQEPEEL